jgi:hypothetical protein
MTKEALKLSALLLWCALAYLFMFLFETLYMIPRGFVFSLNSTFGAAGLGLPFVYGLWQTMAFIDERM